MPSVSYRIQYVIGQIKNDYGTVFYRITCIGYSYTVSMTPIKNALYITYAVKVMYVILHTCGSLSLSY